MTIVQRGGMRHPGPVGLSPGGTPGRPPGTLGLGSVVVFAAPTAVKLVVKTTTMPPPTTTSTTLEARKVAWPLFSGEPATTQVRQGELATCPIAAILAAFAHTAWGRDRIKNTLVAEHKWASGVNTVLTDETMKRFKRDDPDDRAQVKEIASDRYFAVKIKDPPIEVSDVFYVEYTDGTALDPIYMQHRPSMAPEKAAEVLWPAAIEKAYAVMVGNYDKLDEYGPKGTPVNTYWAALAGAQPKSIPITADTELAQIRKAAAAASRTPTIAASRESTTKVLDKHGFAILGMKGSQVDLYDPHGKSLKLSLEEFRTDIEMILFKP